MFRYLERYKCVKLKSLDIHDRNLLLKSYQALYCDENIDISNISTTYKLFNNLYLGNEFLSSLKEMKSEGYAKILASWCGDEGEISDDTLRPGLVKYTGGQKFGILALISLSSKNKYKNKYKNICLVKFKYWVLKTRKND